MGKSCLTCKINIEDYKDDWSKFPCLTCKSYRTVTRTLAPAYFDTADLENMDNTSDPSKLLSRDERAVDIEDITTVKNAEDEDLTEFVTPEVLRFIKEAVEYQFTIVFSNILVKLLKLAKENPVLFEVVLKKMQYPFMSYADIGDTMHPPCSKQNVLYHLRKALDLMPELCSVIHIDTRYLKGKYSLETKINKLRKQQAKRRFCRVLYGDDQIFRATAMRELNMLVSAPFNLNSEVFDFNAYLKIRDGSYPTRDVTRKRKAARKAAKSTGGGNVQA